MFAEYLFPVPLIVNGQVFNLLQLNHLIFQKRSFQVSFGMKFTALKFTKIKKMKKILPFAVLFFVSCSTVLLTGRKQFTAIPASQKQSLSEDSYDNVLNENQLSDNQHYVSMVREVGRDVSTAVESYLRKNGEARRINNYSWEYNDIASEQLNALCMPGGKIAFYEGIMPVCEDKTGVAVLMVHEAAHAIARHGNERMSQQLAIQLGGIALAEALETEAETTQQLALAAFGVGSQIGVVLPYSRTHEKEADELGLYFMAMAGYNPKEAISFWQRMKNEGGQKPPEFLSSHPHSDTRIKNLEKHMNKALEYYTKNEPS